ncbi:MAG: hypothetical protein K940chlam9_00659 [Chlamydiae bacterium]|nr:hypothetical protein [Chlamydiota bacterium]
MANPTQELNSQNIPVINSEYQRMEGHLPIYLHREVPAKIEGIGALYEPSPQNPLRRNQITPLVEIPENQMSTIPKCKSETSSEESDSSSEESSTSTEDEKAQEVVQTTTFHLNKPEKKTNK